MNIAKALKQKNKIIKEIRSLRETITRYNSVYSLTGRPENINIEEIMKQYFSKKEELISLKLKIFEATRSVREHIIRLSELKDTLEFLQGIPTEEGKVHISNYGSSSEFIEKDCVFNNEWVRTRITLTEDEIEKIQDELDAFNHSGEIE